MPHVVDPAKCEGCKACIDTCPTSTITMVGDKAKIGDDCADCAACVDSCPTQAISAQ